MPVIAGLDNERSKFYYDLVYRFLDEAARRALDAMMKNYEYQSDFAKKYVGHGRELARVEKGAHDVLRALRARNVVVPDAARERILSEKDEARLERWLDKAAVATSVADVLDDPS